MNEMERMTRLNRVYIEYLYVWAFIFSFTLVLFLIGVLFLW